MFYFSFLSPALEDAVMISPIEAASTASAMPSPYHTNSSSAISMAVRLRLPFAAGALDELEVPLVNAAASRADNSPPYPRTHPGRGWGGGNWG